MTTNGAPPLVATIRSFPTTLGLTGIVLLVGILTARHTAARHEAMLGRFGLDLDLLRLHHLWTLPIATFVQSSPGVRWHMLLLVAASLALLEYRAGSLRALITFLVAHWISSPLTVVVLSGLARGGSERALHTLHRPDAGSSAAAHGALATALALLPTPWSVIGVSGLLTYSATAIAFQRIDAAVAHLVASVIGAACGWVLWRPQLSVSAASKGQ
jgi:hypothetical protein